MNKTVGFKAALFGALTLGAAALVLPGPAEARLGDPGFGGSIGGGLFGGVRLGPRSAQATQARPATGGVVGENCYLLREQVATPNGGVAVRRAQVCE